MVTRQAGGAPSEKRGNGCGSWEGYGEAVSVRGQRPVNGIAALFAMYVVDVPDDVAPYECYSVAL